jgi:hypothetical protein
LHNEAGSDDRGDTQFHEGTTIGGQNGTNPVKRISRRVAANTIEGNLTTDQEEEQSNDSPHQLLLKFDLETKSEREFRGAREESERGEEKNKSKKKKTQIQHGSQPKSRRIDAK